MFGFTTSSIVWSISLRLFWLLIDAIALSCSSFIRQSSSIIIISGSSDPIIYAFSFSLITSEDIDALIEAVSLSIKFFVVAFEAKIEVPLESGYETSEQFVQIVLFETFLGLPY